MEITTDPGVPQPCRRCGWNYPQETLDLIAGGGVRFDTTPTHFCSIPEGVMRHAKAHYEDGGWDVVVECWTLEEIQRVIDEDRCATLEDALRSFAALVDVWADRQADARNSAF